MQIEPADQQTPKTRLRNFQGAADASALQDDEKATLPGVTPDFYAKAKRPPLLLPIVFIGGMSIMATQMTASRLVQPYFGSSLQIWANLIGFTMICLALGYYLGGRLGDRFPRLDWHYILTGSAALAMALIPLLSDTVLNITKEAGLWLGSLLGIIILFGLPLTLLGCAAPYAIRLLMRNVQGAGRTAGLVSSLSTVGSILGTFLPVLWIMPTIGTRATVYLFAAIMFSFSLVGYFIARRDPELRAVESRKSKVESQVGAENQSKITRTRMGENSQSKIPFLLPIVFICGMAVMATEMSASRLIQPYFGDSLLIWACLIGFIIIYLAIGYYLGGRLADRFPRPAFLYQLTGIAALSMGLIPIASNPILTLSQQGFRSVNGGLFFATLFGIILLFSVPVILLGCVSPFATRLLINNVQGAGRIAGKVSSLSTVGSILGTFLPVLVLIPLVGTRTTLYIFSIVLLAFSAIGLYLTQPRRAPIFAGLLVGVLAMALLLTFQVKAPPYGTLLYEKESAYNYIQVVKQDTGRVDLVLNEGRAVHSIYQPNQLLTGGPWDYYMVTPFFNAGVTEKDVKNVMMIGLGAGTVPKQLTKAYGSQIQVDGIEIDPAIIEAGRKYFDMNEPNLNAMAQDGRFGLLESTKKYDIIGVDAYKQPYIPFHLTTREFFRQVRSRLTPSGVAVINAGSPAVNGKIDYRLAEALAHTLKQEFPNVYMINLYSISGYFNTIVIATNQPTNAANFKQNIEQVVTNELIKTVGMRTLEKGNVREWTGKTDGPEPPIFTDDWAPVERIIDQVIIDYVVGGGK